MRGAQRLLVPAFLEQLKNEYLSTLVKTTLSASLQSCSGGSGLDFKLHRSIACLRTCSEECTTSGQSSCPTSWSVNAFQFVSKQLVPSSSHGQPCFSVYGGWRQHSAVPQPDVDEAADGIPPSLIVVKNGTEVTWPPYSDLKAAAEASKPMQLTLKQRSAISSVIDGFFKDADVRRRARELYVNDELLRESSVRFRRWFRRGCGASICDEMTRENARVQDVRQQLFVYYAQYVLDNYRNNVEQYRAQVESMDMRRPHMWFPVARALQRKIIYHAGPTNSGKTYSALQALKGAKRGVYCAPLRLLAMEVYDRLNADGIRTSLITGQEKELVPGAEHIACTIEMVRLNDLADVAVIDEIQMIGDSQRGFAWTRALLGLPALEIHVCGDPTAMALVRKMCEDCGDEFEVQQYERFSSLMLEDRALTCGYRNVRRGDCIVAFSRRDIYKIRQEVEARTGYRACVIYGALPPETRRMQARLFNEDGSPFDVLVASDAVGMGLNLNIRRVVFHSVFKRMAQNMPTAIPPMQIKQIAGRAGRRGGMYPDGYVACMNADDLPIVEAALRMRIDDVQQPSAGLFPEFEQIELFASKCPSLSFSQLLQSMASMAQLDGRFFFCDQEHMVASAKALEGVSGLSLEDCYNFVTAPCNMRDARLAAAFRDFVWQFAAGGPVTCPIQPPPRHPTSPEEIKHFETAHQVCALWLWLRQRYMENEQRQHQFFNADRVIAVNNAIVTALNQGLEQLTNAAGADDAPRIRPPKLRGVRKHSKGDDERHLNGNGDSSALAETPRGKRQRSRDSSSEESPAGRGRSDAEMKRRKKSTSWSDGHGVLHKDTHRPPTSSSSSSSSRTTLRQARVS